MGVPAEGAATTKPPWQPLKRSRQKSQQRPQPTHSCKTQSTILQALPNPKRMASIMDAGTPKLRVVTQLLALDTRLLRRLQNTGMDTRLLRHLRGYWVGYKDTTMVSRFLDWILCQVSQAKGLSLIQLSPNNSLDTSCLCHLIKILKKLSTRLSFQLRTRPGK